MHMNMGRFFSQAFMLMKMMAVIMAMEMNVLHCLMFVVVLVTPDIGKNNTY
jgi:hypothetical protein